MIIEGFLRVRFPLFIRRAVTMVPALIVIGMGWDPLRILMVSQVALSFALPFAIVPLIWLNASKRVMGKARLGWGWTSVSALVAAGIVALNIWLIGSLLQTR